MVDFKTAVVVSDPTTGRSASVGLLPYEQASFKKVVEDLVVKAHADDRLIWLSIAGGVASTNIKNAGVTSSTVIDNNHQDWLAAVTAPRLHPSRRHRRRSPAWRHPYRTV